MAVVDIATRTVTVNAAFLREIKEVNQELWDVLGRCREYCQRPTASYRPCSRFVDQLRETLDLLAMHFALEEAYGYFEDPIHVAPRLAERCELLRAEHASLYVEFSSLVEAADDLLHEQKTADIAALVPPAFQGFDKKLLRHEGQEIDLIQEAFDADLGGGD